MDILIVILLAAILITLLGAWGVIGWTVSGVIVCILIVKLFLIIKAVFNPFRQENNLSAIKRKERDNLLATMVRRTELGYDIDEQMKKLEEIEKDL